MASAALPLGFFSALNLTSSPPAFKIVSSATFALGPVAPNSFVSAVGTGLPATLDNLAIVVTVGTVSRARPRYSTHRRPKSISLFLREPRRA